jgi:S1-C subfamily serine protease
LTAVKWAAEPAAVGQKVTAMAYGARPTEPDSMGFAKGIVSGVNLKAKLHPLLPPMTSLIAYQAPASQGSSGTPVVNEKGEAVAVNMLVGDAASTSNEGFVYALSARYVRDLLAQLRPGKTTAYVGWKSQHRCHHAMKKIAATSGGRVGSGSTDIAGDSGATHKHD